MKKDHIDKYRVGIWFELAGRKPTNIIPMPSSLIPIFADEAYMVKAKGNGMYPDIKNGDTLICQWTTKVQNGDMAILLDSETGDMQCKFVMSFNNMTLFQNAKKEIFEFAGYRLCGKVVTVIKNL